MFSKFIYRMEQTIEVVTGILFIGLLGFTSLNILLRNVLGVSWLFVDGLVRLMFIWMVFLGTSALYYRGDHLVMDFFQEKMPPGMRRSVESAGEILFLLFMAALLLYGIQVTKVRMEIPFETWAVPTGYAYLAVPVCASIMALFCINHIVSRSKK